MRKVHAIATLSLAGLASLASLTFPAHAGTSADLPAAAARTPAADDDTTDRFIVKLRSAAGDPAARVAGIGRATGERLSHLRAMSGNAHVVQLARRVGASEARAVARLLAQDAAVESIEPDVRVHPQAVPNDPMYQQQWHYWEAAGGINLPGAWDVTTGSAAITVAVIDTGIVPHAELAGRLVGGYDFIGSTTASNDGDGRDADARDPGDYGCSTGSSSSSWHGTHVAGTIGAASNNGVGVTGINWVSKIVPVRVLGKCGGYLSDIIDGLRWSAGIAVSGVPANAYPARVANLSLGGSGACSTQMQQAVNDVVAKGMVVVVAAGNSNADAATQQPASCSNVVTVGATVRNGGRASYSNYGSKLTLSAPGGGSGGGVLSTLNAGSTTPGADSYAYYQGTSMATPHVAGVVSLMLSAQPSLTPAQVIARLKQTARAFPTGTGADCTTATCGAGIVDAAAAVGTSTAPRVNLALASNGAVASASSTYPYGGGFVAANANNGERKGVTWGNGGGWNNANGYAFPDWLQIDFGSTKTVAEVDVFTVQDAYRDPVEPDETMTFRWYGVSAFDVQYWNGSAWVTVPGGSITNNNKVWRRVTFAPVSTSRIRVVVYAGGGGYARITEVEAYETAGKSPTATNVALAANGGVAVGSSTFQPGFEAANVIDGDRRGLVWGSGGGWNDANGGVFPDIVRIDFNGTKTIDEIDVFTVQDAYNSPADPTETLTFSQWGITDFDVQYWNGSAWVTVPGGGVTGNNKVWRKFAFTAVSTSSIRVVVNGGGGGYTRITEIEAWAP